MVNEGWPQDELQQQRLYQFLIAAVPTHHKLCGLEQHKLIFLQFFESEVQYGQVSLCENQGVIFGKHNLPYVDSPFGQTKSPSSYILVLSLSCTKSLKGLLRIRKMLLAETGSLFPGNLHPYIGHCMALFHGHRWRPYDPHWALSQESGFGNRKEFIQRRSGIKLMAAFLQEKFLSCY